MATNRAFKEYQLNGTNFLELKNGVTLANFHVKGQCTGDCPVHSDTIHHMSSWPLIWNQDKFLFERECVCGVRHPDPDSLAYIRKSGGNRSADNAGVHPCECNCCGTLQKERQHALPQ